MDENIRNVRSYKKTPVIAVPEIPEYFKHLLPSTSTSSLPSSPTDLQESPSTMLLSPLGSPFDVLINGSSSQPRLWQSQQSDEQKLAYKFERMEGLLKDSGFDSVGEILEVLFYNPSRISGESDPRGSFHAKAVSRFLQGRNKIKMSDIIVLIYGINTVHPHRLHHVIPSVMPHFLLLSLLRKYFMLVLPYSHGQPTSSLHTFIRRSTSFLVQIFQVTKIIFELL